MEAGRLDQTATLLRCLGRLSNKADKVQETRESDNQAKGGIQETRRSGWSTGYRAVLEAVQELVKLKTGGASLALCC